MTPSQSSTIDLLSPESFAHGHPHQQYAWLRENDPVHHHPEPDGPGFWAVTRFRDVKTVSQHPDLFSSSPTIMIPDASGMELGDHSMMLTMDPPRHTGYRRLVGGDFVPRAVRAMRPRMAELAASIVDGVVEKGECDLVEDVAGLMPSYVIADMLGIPQQDGVALYRLTETIHAAPGSVPDGAGFGAVMEMFNYARSVWEEKRARPADDLSTRLIHGEVDGRPLDEIDFNLFFLLLVDAGGDTTRNLLAGGMVALFEHPDQRDRLRADLDGLLAPTIEELLRWVSPVIYMRRRATRDTTLGGRDIAEGDKVVMYYGSANRDPEAFDDPDRLDIGRRPNNHVAFGAGGPHFCMGAHLGRLEVEALLREVLTRLPDLHPTGEAEWLASNFISGPSHLPVAFTPGPRSS
ncbi:MAG TPA: cytochrome P450 [Acidimicrobiales bacterium]|nr:cytochrome P450 [Acidimicrobiales bacterium]